MRSQRRLRIREGIDNQGVTAYERGEESIFTQLQQRTKAIARGGRPPAACTVLPAITGTLTSGQVQTTTNGTYTGQGSVTFTRRWMRSPTPTKMGDAIAGATGTTYTLAAGDVGKYIYCEVTATDSYGAVKNNSNIRGPVT